jgi:biopolymer transport protein ExbB
MRSTTARLPFIAVALICLLVIPLAAHAWWNDDWSFRKQIALDGDTIGAPGTEALADFPVPIRLHAGNFSYFLDTRRDGADLRFVGGDDTTPLAFHVENYDQAAGIGVLWIKVPRLGVRADPEEIYLYYGATEAKPAADSAATFEPAYSAVFHFGETEGLPHDATGYRNDAVASTLRLAGTGILDRGVQLSGSESMTLPDMPALNAGSGKGYTLSTWLLLEDGAATGRIATQGDAAGRLQIEARGSTLVAHLGPDASAVELAATQPLVIGRWQHVALTLDDTAMKLYVNGKEAATAPASRQALAGPMTIGALPEQPGLKGRLDELQISSVARPAAWVAATAAVQNPDTKLYTYFEDIAAEGEGLAGAYLQLLQVSVQKLSLDGWVIIGITVLLGLISIDVMVSKSIMLARTERADSVFMQHFRRQARAQLESDISGAANAATSTERPLANSTLLSLYRSAVTSAQQLRGEEGSDRLSPQAIEALRSAIDIRLVEETNRLNSRLVLVTLAVSGGPFLGLLGTVVGVMITFTSVAASGDVNVSTIAPGVASAMATTVVGLLIAIPSMFGYNFLATRVSRITALMEVFSGQLIAQIATTGGNSHTEVSDAA